MLYEYNNPCPSLICPLLPKDTKIHLNYFRNITSDKDITIKITSVENFQLKSLVQSMIITNKVDEMIDIMPPDLKLIIIVEPKVNYIYYSRAFDENTKIYMAEYDNTKMKVDDIVNINKNYFTEIKDKIIETTKNKIYILVIKNENSNSLTDIYSQPKERETEIKLSEIPIPKIFYFIKDKEYIIDFANNKYERMIQLSKLISDNEITIKNLLTQKEFTLNANNAYYTFETTNAIFKDKLSIKVTKGNHTMIEFLFDPTDFEILSDITARKEIGEEQN